MTDLTPAQVAEERRRLDEEGLTKVIIVEPLRFLAGQLVKVALLVAIVRRASPRRNRGRR